MDLDTTVTDIKVEVVFVDDSFNPKSIQDLDDFAKKYRETQGLDDGEDTAFDFEYDPDNQQWRLLMYWIVAERLVDLLDSIYVDVSKALGTPPYLDFRVTLENGHISAQEKTKVFAWGPAGHLNPTKEEDVKDAIYKKYAQDPIF